MISEISMISTMNFNNSYVKIFCVQIKNVNFSIMYHNFIDSEEMKNSKSFNNINIKLENKVKNCIIEKRIDPPRFAPGDRPIHSSKIVLHKLWIVELNFGVAKHKRQWQFQFISTSMASSLPNNRYNVSSSNILDLNSL